MHMRTVAHTSKIGAFRGACAYVQACAIAQPHTLQNNARSMTCERAVQFAFFPLHNHFCLLFDHNICLLITKTSIILLILQDSQSNVSDDLRYD